MICGEWGEKRGKGKERRGKGGASTMIGYPLEMMIR